MGGLTTFRSFGWPSRLLMINQFGINLGFYMLMPYLAGYLAGPLGLAAWAVGLVLGVRNFSQQGMFIVGGTLADRLGYKPLIVAGCLLRTAGFGLLVFAHSLPAVLIASAATGFAGALFNPGGAGLPGCRCRGAPSGGVRAVQRLLSGRDPGRAAGRTGLHGGGFPAHRGDCRGGVRAADHRAVVRSATARRRRERVHHNGAAGLAHRGGQPLVPAVRRRP